MRVRRLVSVGVALTLLIGLITGVTIVGLQHPGPPVQVTGTAAGLPHRVPASVTMGQAAAGHSGAARGAGTAASARKGQPGFIGPAAGGSPPGAVPPATAPKPVRLPVQGPPPQQRTTVLPAPASVKKSGYVAATSRPVRPSTANQVVYANADGTKTAFTYQSPVNYQRTDGTWVTASSTLVPNATKLPYATPTQSTSAATLSAFYTVDPSPSDTPAPDANAAPPGTATPSPSDTASPAGTSSGDPSPAPTDTTPPAGGWTEQSQAEPQSFAAYANDPNLVTVPVNSSEVVAFGVAGAAAVPGAAQGDTIGYQNVLPASSIEFTAGAGLVKEQIVLNSAAAPMTWVFPLDLTGLQARMGADGNIQFTDATGQVLAYVPHGFMTDANIDPHSGDGALSDGVTYSLITYQGGPAIQMTLDIAWLGSADRVFPVTVDPSIQTTPRPSTGTTYVESPFTNDNSNGQEIKVGTYNGGTNTAKSFLTFDVSTLANDHVLGARLNLFNSWSYSCQARPVYVYPVTTSNWQVTGNKSWPGPSTGAAIGSASFAAGWAPASGASPCGAKWEGIALNQAGTDLINSWTHNSSNNHGLAVGASTTDSYGWKKFASFHSGSWNPVLEVTYSPDAAEYKLASSKPVTPITPSSPGVIALYVRNTGATTWNMNGTNGYKISYRAYNASKALVANHPVFTVMPQNIGPNSGWVKVNVNIAALPAGAYALDFDMYASANGSSPVAFSAEGVPQFAVGLNIPQPPPTVSAVYPPTGYISPTLAPELSTVAATGTGTITYPSPRLPQGSGAATGGPTTR
jgi:hypothetical protein